MRRLARLSLLAIVSLVIMLSSGNAAPTRAGDFAAAGAEADTISIGWYHSCPLKDAGVWRWGYNGYGQLGNNDRLAGCVTRAYPSERARSATGIID